MAIELQHSVVYGPIKSRRLGVSLGLNLLPRDEKFCLSSCVYCQYGPTRLDKMAEVKIPPAEEILNEVRREFEERAEAKLELHAITFSGNGEPTLHPELKEIVREVKSLRDRYFPGVKVGVFSDSSRVHLPRVREALELFDERYMKLDAGDSETYHMINQPLVRFDWGAMIDGLKKMPDLTVQSLFIHGYPVDNSSGPAFLHWLKLIQEIKPKALHVYTIDRAPVDFRTRPVPKKRLCEIADLVHRSAGVDTYVFESGDHQLCSAEPEAKKWEF